MGKLIMFYPNNKHDIINHGGLVIVEEDFDEISIVFLATGHLHGWPVTTNVYMTNKTVLPNVIAQLNKSIETFGEYLTLKVRTLLNAMESATLIAKKADVNYYHDDVTSLLEGNLKKVSIIPNTPLNQAIIEETQKMEAVKTESKEESFPDIPVNNGELASYDELHNLFADKKADPVDDKTIRKYIEMKNQEEIKAFIGAGPSFREVITTLLSVASNYPVSFTIQEKEKVPGNVVLLLNCPILPELTFTGTTGELATEFIPSLLEAVTNKKSDINFTKAIEKQIELRKQEALKKASEKQSKQKEKPSKSVSKTPSKKGEDEDDEDEEDDNFDGEFEEESEEEIKPKVEQKSLF